MTTRWARIARGTIAALVSTFVALFFHGVAGGPIPPLAALVACVVFAALVCIALTGATLSRIRLALSVGVSQFVLHSFFIMFSGAGTAVVASTGGHVHGVEAIAAQLAVLEPGHASAHVHDSAMWIGHALAAVITFAALRYGERSFWALLELGRRTTSAIARRMPLAAIPVRRPVSLIERVSRERPRTSRPLLSVLRHRGPPVLLSV